MRRNYSKDIKFFDLKKDGEWVSKLYYAYEIEVENFLRESHEAGKLERVTNKEVYNMIAKNLGYRVPN